MLSLLYVLNWNVLFKMFEVDIDYTSLKIHFKLYYGLLFLYLKVLVCQTIDENVKNLLDDSNNRRVLEAVKKTFSVNDANQISCNIVTADTAEKINITLSNNLNINVDCINNKISKNKNILENNNCSDFDYFDIDTVSNIYSENLDGLLT